jgi:hypothetical protein
MRCRHSLHQTINRMRAAAALPSVIGGPGSVFTSGQAPRCDAYDCPLLFDGQFFFVSNETCFMAQRSPKYTSHIQRRSLIDRSIIASSSRLGGGAPTCTTLFRSSEALTTSLMTFAGNLIGLPSAHVALTGKVGRKSRRIFRIGGACTS